LFCSFSWLMLIARKVSAVLIRLLSLIHRATCVVFQPC
jgi:hypothetical protein